jgi:hypothetical protein
MKAPASAPDPVVLFEEALLRRREHLPLSKRQVALLLAVSERWVERNLKPTSQFMRDGRVFYFWDHVEAALRERGRDRGGSACHEDENASPRRRASHSPLKSETRVAVGRSASRSKASAPDSLSVEEELRRLGVEPSNRSSDTAVLQPRGMIPRSPTSSQR